MSASSTEAFRLRTKGLSLRVIKLFRTLSNEPVSQVIGKQILRSATSVGANHRAACRARSRAEFVAKLGIVVEELDETVYWLELLVEAEIVDRQRMAPLHEEATQLLAMFCQAQLTAKRNSASGLRHS